MLLIHLTGIDFVGFEGEQCDSDHSECCCATVSTEKQSTVILYFFI